MRFVWAFVALVAIFVMRENVGVGAACTVVLFETAVCDSACDAPGEEVTQLHLIGTLDRQSTASCLRLQCVNRVLCLSGV
jgi:hypothetical protein